MTRVYSFLCLPGCLEVSDIGGRMRERETTTQTIESLCCKFWHYNQLIFPSLNSSKSSSIKILPRTGILKTPDGTKTI